MPKLIIRFTTHNFHKFWCLQVLQDIYMKIHQNVQSRKRRQAKHEKGHILTDSGGHTHEDEAQAHPAIAPAKAV